MDTQKTQETATGYREKIVAEIPRLKAFLRNLAPGDAEDILQDTFERALRYRTAFDRQRSTGPWLIKIAFRVFLDHRATKARAPKLLGEEIMEIPAPHSKTDENKEKISLLLNGLCEREKELLLRFHCRGESLCQIARDTRTPCSPRKRGGSREKRAPWIAPTSTESR